jgi:flagellar hook-length control protein FliK
MQIVQAASRRIERLVVQLEPAALGRVEVRLDFSRDNRVSALIAAERPETLDLLQRDSRALERGLQDAGLELEREGLSFSLRQEQRHHERGAGSHPAMTDPEPPAAPAITGNAAPPAASRWLDAERILDIRI